jgi:predicted O-linked N-acetylglucosamine transferase (SPINDLY family)
MEFGAYLRAFSEGDLLVDSAPFGACNTLLDALVCGVPAVVWEGERWNSRIGAAMLRRLGLEEFIVKNEQQFVDAAAALAADEGKYLSAVRRFRSAPLERLFQTDEAEYFTAALEFLMDNHERLQRDGGPAIVRLVPDDTAAEAAIAA